MIEKILVPVDGSPHSVKAVELASDLASKYDAQIILLHVLLRGHMPDGLKKALEIEVNKHEARADNLVNIPQEIMARVGSKKNVQLSFEELDFIGKYMLSNVAVICQDKGVSKVELVARTSDRLRGRRNGVVPDVNLPRRVSGHHRIHDDHGLGVCPCIHQRHRIPVGFDQPDPGQRTAP